MAPSIKQWQRLKNVVLDKVQNCSVDDQADVGQRVYVLYDEGVLK